MAKPNFAQSGPVDQNRFAICDSSDNSKQLQINVTPLAASKQVVLQADPANDGVFTLPPLTGAVLQSMGKIVQYLSVATAAFTATVSAASQVFIVDAAGTLTTFSAVLPAAPADGTKVCISPAVAVTNFALTGGGSDTVAGGPAALTANTPIAVVYYASGTKWYRSV